MAGTDKQIDKMNDSDLLCVLTVVACHGLEDVRNDLDALAEDEHHDDAHLH